MTPKVIWFVLLALPIPLTINYFVNLWDNEQYQFFPVLVVACLGMLFGRWDRIFGRTTRASFLLGCLGVIACICASLIYSPWLGFFSALIILTSFAASNTEKLEANNENFQSRNTLVYATIPLWLCLRIPLNLDQQLTIGLQHLTAKVSSFALDSLAIPHDLTGVVFELASGKLFVEEACSGVQSLFAVLSVALLLMAWNRREIILTPIYCIAAIFSAALLNIARVVAIAVSQEMGYNGLASGWRHDLLGYFCLFMAILLLASFDRLFRVAFYPISDENNPFGSGNTANPIKLAWNFAFAPAPPSETSKSMLSNHPPVPASLMILTIGVGLVCWSLQITFAAQYALRPKQSLAEARVGGTEMFWSPSPQLFGSEPSITVESFQSLRNGEDISRGQNTDIWLIHDSQTNLRHRIAISQPYDEFHDLCVCYEGNGWRLSTREVIRKDVDDISINGWEFIFSSWYNDSGSYAYLTFSGLNRDNTPSAVPIETMSDLLTNRFSLGSGLKSQPKECLMIQVWTTLDAPLSVKEQEALKTLQIRLRDIARAAYEKK